MKHCPKCGSTYLESFLFCPADGAELETSDDAAADVVLRSDETQPPLPPERYEAQISVRTLMISLAVLLLAGITSFAAVFLYQYLKPRYGALVVKTTPAGAMVYVDGKQRGISPVTVGELRSGGHQVKAVKEGYKELLQLVSVMPYATQNVHLTLDALVPHLSNEQLAEVESLRKKLDSAQRESLLLPPPDDYNVLLFANKILAIDPANSYALDVKSKLAESLRHSADLAYASENWLEAEKQYKNLALLFPDDISINERLADLAAKIDASMKDRDKQIAEWTAKADAAIKAGVLVPPEKDNALDALRNIQRLDKKNVYADHALTQLKESLQNRGDSKINAGDWAGAHSDFRTILQYFPEDAYSKSRLALADGKLAEAAQAEQQRLQKLLEEQESRQRIAGLKLSAINSFRSGAIQKSISEWQEYLKVEPNSDEAYFYLGAAYQEEKQLDTAILNYEKCLSLNPNNTLAHLNLGILYDHHRNDTKRAVEHYQRVKELGGAEKYSPERIQTMIQDLLDREQLDALQKTPFAAEHKHAFSSCKGNLRVTADGIEYKTVETDHSFFEPYGDLRSFSVAGDEISIRTRTNKKYNFRLLNQGDGAQIRRLASRHMQVSE
jgi:tetratricopeptide (TPR) repeat protein